MSGTIPRKNEQQWIETRGGRDVTITKHPVRAERVEFLNEPDDPTNGPLTLKFFLGIGHKVDVHSHPEQTETITVNEGRIRATVDGEERELDVGGNLRIPPGVPHGYEVIGNDEVTLSVSITPALSFKDFIIAEHALDADAYGESGLNLFYTGLVAKEYGPMLAPPWGPLQIRLGVALLSLIARLKRLRIPNEPLPQRNVSKD